MKRVVIVGAGFGGLSVVRQLNRLMSRDTSKPTSNFTSNVTSSISKNKKASRDRGFEVYLIDRNNHHLFQPLLYQVATGGLSAVDITSTIRYEVHHYRNVYVLMDQVVGVSDSKKTLFTQRHGSLKYDFLVIATGSQTSYFGHDQWSRFACGLKSVEDALGIRSQILRAFEKAEHEPEHGVKRRNLLTFAVIGGGPTGVELAGALAELAHQTLNRDFRNISFADLQIFLVEKGEHVLSGFPERLRLRAEAHLQKLGVQLLLGNPVDDIQAHRLLVAGQWINAEVMIWTSGVMATQAGGWLGIKGDQRIPVEGDLRVQGFSHIYAIGDVACASSEEGGAPLPGLAPVAIQQGRYVAGEIYRRIYKPNSDVSPHRRHLPFRYKDRGIMATIGYSKAVASFRGLQFGGTLGWLVWAFIHILFLVDFHNKISVLFDWVWSYFSKNKSSRIILQIDRQK